MTSGKAKYVDNSGEREESKRKYTYKETIADESIKDISYRSMFSKMGETGTVTRSMWHAATEMIDHRSGSKFEDLAFINSKTGKTIIRKDYNVENTALPTKAMKKYIAEHEPYTIIAIHNHPGSSVPSVSDLRSAYKHSYKFGLACGHNGTVYKYSVMNGFNEREANFFLDILHNGIYNNIVKDIDSSLSCLEKMGIQIEVL